MKEEMQRKFEGIWIPAEIWLTRELSMQEKIMLVEICSLDKEEGCYASNAYFADFFGLSKTRISQILKQLETKGLIIVSYIYSGKEVEKRIIHINGEKFMKYLGGKFPKGGGKFPKEGGKFPKLDNINNNIINNNIDTNIFLEKNIEQNNIDIRKNKKKLTKKQLKELQLKEENKKIDTVIAEFTKKYMWAVDIIKNYVDVRKAKGLTAAQLRIILEDLENECGDNKDYMATCIRRAIAGGWSQIVFTTTKDIKSNTFKDNVANHTTGNPKISDLDFRFMTLEARKDYISHMDLADMTKDQREFFDKYCLSEIKF